MKALQANQRLEGIPMLKIPQQYDLMNKMNQSHFDTKPTEFDRQGNYEHDPFLTDKHLKADLIRRNLLSRKDLMLMYKLPQNKALLPINNPWVTKSILEPSIGKPSRNWRGVSKTTANRISGSQRSPRSSAFYSQQDTAFGSSNHKDSL